MVTQTSLDVQAIATPQIFTHIVTLINRWTGHEVMLTVETLSDRFVDVIREVAHLKAVRKLAGYEIFEVLDCNDAF